MEKFKVSFAPYTLDFINPAGTSRGILKTKLTYFIKIESNLYPGEVGYGEVPYFHGLSPESQDHLESLLVSLTQYHTEDSLLEIAKLSSPTLFGVEQAICAIKNKGLIFPSPFTKGTRQIQINGLIWMNPFEIMKEAVKKKLEQGFQCIKLKIGAINWDDEIDLIRYIRNQFSSSIMIRVDANGAFAPEDCMKKLDELSKYDIHSIEQPIRAGNFQEMKRICEMSPIPVALDEELIGHPVSEERSQLLEFIRPSFIILKPALCYGFSGAYDWISRAKKLNIGWWITSAIESSVGLNAIAQFTGKLGPKDPQGLGTGSLFLNNFASQLNLNGELLSFKTTAHSSYDKELEGFEWKQA